MLHNNNRMKWIRGNKTHYDKVKKKQITIQLKKNETNDMPTGENVWRTKSAFDWYSVSIYSYISALPVIFFLLNYAAFCDGIWAFFFVFWLLCLIGFYPHPIFFYRQSHKTCALFTQKVLGYHDYKIQSYRWHWKWRRFLQFFFSYFILQNSNNAVDVVVAIWHFQKKNK